MDGKLKYEFVGEMWLHSPTGGWHFISLPKKIAVEIRQCLKPEEEGWGRLKANAIIGQTQWKTAIWFDTKLGTFLLPIKAEIRKKEKLSTGQSLSVTVIL